MGYCNLIGLTVVSSATLGEYSQKDTWSWDRIVHFTGQSKFEWAPGAGYGHDRDRAQ
jgi:hypothetical protein